MNGNHAPSDTAIPAIEPTTNVVSGIEPVAQFLPDTQPDTNSLFDSSDVTATSIPNAVEAPTSDVRDEAGPALNAQSETQATNESTQQVPETQLSSVEEASGDLNANDAMDISHEALRPTTSQDSNTAPTKPMTELSLQTQQSSTSPSQFPKVESPSNVDQEMEDAPASGKVRSREEDDEDDVPDAKRPKTEAEAGDQSEFKVPELPVHTEQTNGNGVAQATQVPPTPPADVDSGVQAAARAEEWPSMPMTPAQNKFLLERVRNTKKIKVSSAFKEAVDHVALNIPTYPDVVKNPMDLTTMENKLKESKYTYVRDFMEDLDLIIDNSVAFNGKEHPVTQAGYNMRAYFLKGMGKMPRTASEEPPKQVKKKQAVPTSTKPRRESRVASATAKSPTAPTPTAASPQSAWPLNADGMPLIRRDSSSANDRPKREIHRPPPKDLPYNTAKPKKKKYQQELKFCESVLGEIMKPKYSKFAYPFMTPVDPVALNIPSYLKIIKKPMDFGTIEKNLKAGQYQTAKDFYNDAQLVFQNCYKFNPENDEVHKMGKQLNELFDSFWKEKSDWLAQHAPASDPQSPGSAYSDEEEEEEEEEDPAQAQILAIQQQIAALNETAQSLLQQQKGKRPSPKAATKKKSGKPPAPKKKSSLAVPPPPKAAKSKPKPRAPPPLSFNQKQEISEGISTLGDAEMRRAVQIIRNGCPHLANVNDDEMELDMDEIGDETLRELFKFIKSVKGPRGAVDDDFEPARPTHKAATASKPKKNKPMGKKEQEDSIKRIQDQLKHFNDQSASGSSQSPPGKSLVSCQQIFDTNFSLAHDVESSDDESSGSESEEE